VCDSFCGRLWLGRVSLERLSVPRAVLPADPPLLEGFENGRNPSFDPPLLAGVDATRASLGDMAGA
jgi:hypothetical protein